MEEDLVLEVDQGLNIVICKIVQLIVNGQNGIMVHAPSHVEVANKLFYEQKELNLKMVEDLVLEVDQGLKFVKFKIVQLIVNGQHGVKKVNALDLVEVASKSL